jgi:tetratricopeptide (TPR) repeat protein
MGLFHSLLAFLFRKKATPQAGADPSASNPTRAADATELQARHDQWADEALRRAKEDRPPRPRILSAPEGSPWMAVQGEGGMVMMMDRDAYNYMYGEAKGPDPAQRDLDALAPRVERVRVLAGGMLEGKALGNDLLLETSEAAAVRAFRDCLKIIEDPQTFNHCMCLGGPTLELCAGRELLATLGMQHGHAIRWAKWKHDAHLRDGRCLNNWLTDHGIPPEVLDLLFRNQPLPGGVPLEGLGADMPEPIRQQIRRGELFRRLGKLEDALAACARALALDPGAADAYCIRAVVRRQQGDLPGTVADCSAAIRLGTRQSEAYVTRAVALDLQGRPDLALADCDAALHLDPKDANAYNSRGLICSRLGRVTEAVADCTTAIRLAPQWFLPYLNRAQAYHHLRRLDDALFDYDRALDLMGRLNWPAQQEVQAGPTPFPTPQAVHCLRGAVHLDRGDKVKAEADFDKAMQWGPAAMYRIRGQIWLQRRDFRRAIDDFSRLTEFRAHAVEGRINRGLARMAADEPESAITDFTEALRLDPGAAAAYGPRGEIYARQGRWEEALGDFTQLIRLQPTNVPAYLACAHIYARLGLYDRQRQDLEEAMRLAPEDLALRNNLAWLLATCPEERIRDGARAVALAKEACEATDWSQIECLDTLAAAYAEGGEFDEARRLLETVLLLVPDPERRAKYQARLALYQVHEPYRDRGGT